MKHLTPEKLSAYLDNELRGQAQEEAKAHLVSCAECREELARLAALEKLTRASELEPREEAYFQAFSSRVLEGIAREKPVPLGESLKEWFNKLTAVPVFRLQWLGGLAVAALVIGFGIYIYERPEVLKPAYKASAPGMAKNKTVGAPPTATERKPGEVGVVTVAPSLSGGLSGPASETRRNESAGTDRGAGGLAKKAAETEQPVALPAKAPMPEAILGSVPAEKPAMDKSMAATARGEATGEGTSKEKIEDLKARPEGYAASPVPGTTSIATGAKEENHLARMASPTERAKTGETLEQDEVLFAEAQTKQSNQYFRDAAKDYDSLVRNYPRSARYDDANYNLALSEYANSQQTHKPEDLKRALKVSKTFLKAVRDTARKAQVNRQVVVLEKQLKEIK